MSRALIFLFDGTGNDPASSQEAEPTNVFNINSLIAEAKKTDDQPRSQVTFYVPGIGTRFYSGGAYTKIKQYLFGDGIDEMVMRSYVNLAANYRAGDKIAVLGFSRGAVAARAFCRLVSDFGLLKSRYIGLFSDLFAAFSEARDSQSIPKYFEMAAKKSGEYQGQMIDGSPGIEFLGLFECVCGPYDPYRNFVDVIDIEQSKSIRNYLHLMSLHDVRDIYRLCRMRPLQSEGKNNYGREIWVPGVHSDVGGGYRDDLISRISLLTMARALEKEAEIGLSEENIAGLESSIRELINIDRIFINKEPDTGPIRYRPSYMVASDKAHRLHQFMVGKSVIWKGESGTIYEDRFGDLLTIDAFTTDCLDRIVGSE